MSSELLFASVEFDKYDPDLTLPSKFQRLIDSMGLESVVKDKWTAIKMHMGREIGYTTVHPLFIKILVDKLTEMGAKVFITDHIVEGSKARGYTEEYFGVPIVASCGVIGNYYYVKDVGYETFHHVDIAGHIHDAEVMIDLSHVKGHGACGYGGACKNIAMGCVTDRTRRELHALEGGIHWNESACTACNVCIESCSHKANKFDDEGKYKIFFHDCTFCQHCIKVCPNEALTITESKFESFQTGMAICTEEVLKTFKPGHVFYINFLLNITALCDCWGFSTSAIVPDIGIMAGQDIVAIERACLDSIKLENLLSSGIPRGLRLKKDSGHLLQQLHGKNPYIQIDQLEKHGLGVQEYTIREID